MYYLNFCTSLSFYMVPVMKFQQGYLELSTHIQQWLTHSSWEYRKKIYAWQFS